LTTTSEGYVLDARQGKTLNDKITKIRRGTVNSGDFTVGTWGGTSGYYKDVSFGVTLSSPTVIVSWYNMNTASFGQINKPVVASNIGNTSFRIWSSDKLDGYYINWIAVGF